MVGLGSMKRNKQKDITVRPFLPAFLVFLALLFLIGASWRTARLDIRSQQKNAVNQSASFIEDTLKQRFNTYEDSLRAANALFVSSNFVTRDEWKSFVTSLDLSTRYPGIRGLGYIKIVSSADKPALEEVARADGIPNYAVYPNRENSELYAPLLYIVPLGGTSQSTDRTSPALGFDMYSDPLRKEAMLNSAKTGKPTLSGVLNLVQAPGQPASRGFLMFLPYYKKDMPLNSAMERLAAVEGYFYAPFITSSVFITSLDNLSPSFAFALYEGTPSNTAQIYKSKPNFEDADFTQARQNSISLYGQNWSIVYKIKQEIVPDSLRKRPASTLIGGSIFALALASIIYLLIQRRTRALHYNEEKKLEEAKDELLSLASHQLRTPATAVKQYVSMVKDGFAGIITGEQRKLLQMAYESNERQLTIVDDLLYVARLDAGQATLRLETVNVTELIQSVINDQKSDIKDRGQTVTFTKPRVAVKTQADSQYLRMIFENLLSNASKYSHPRKKITVELKSGNKGVIISFSDKGVGIDAKDFAEVFKKFSRIPNALTRQIAGSGIGLYLAKQLALLHGGDITFNSKLKKGSTFTVTLPKRKHKK